MKNWLIVLFSITLLLGGISQQQPAPAPKPPAKTGSLSANGKLVSFFFRGEGTLQVKGTGVLLVADAEGDMQVSGFKELKQLPRNVTLKPAAAKRIRVFQGTGSITLKGKCLSFRVKMTPGEMSFNGIGSFNIDGNGKYRMDGKEFDLFASGTQTLLIPPPPAAPPPPAPKPSEPHEDH